jgi:L-asparaginase II
LRVRRGAAVESIHRGAWVVVDARGAILRGAGDFEAPVYARSTIKAVQVLPLLESGGAERFGLGDEELALAMASHDGEEIHTAVAARVLRRIGVGADALRCGPQPPGNADARFRMRASGATPTALHNNCSGKHAAFLAQARHLGVPLERYLDPGEDVQRRVRRALAELAGVEADRLALATDGCSAPTFRLPLAALALAFARLSNPDELAPERRAHCERLLDAAGRHPELVGGSAGRLCTELLRATGGRLFPKVGAEAVYAIGVRGAGLGIAVAIDDGASRGLYPIVAALLEAEGLLRADELAPLARWRERRLLNRAGLEVGALEPVIG